MYQTLVALCSNRQNNYTIKIKIGDFLINEIKSFLYNCLQISGGILKYLQYRYSIPNTLASLVITIGVGIFLACLPDDCFQCNQATYTSQL